MIKAVINVEAPRPQVFTVLTDYPRYKDWLPGCEQSSVLSGSGAAVDTEIVINSMKKMTLGLRFEAQPTQLLNFRMVSGKDIKAYNGSYRLMDSADGKGTVVIAELELDAGPLAPRFLVDRMAKKAIDETGVALRKYIQKMPAAAVAAPAAAAPARVRHARRILQVVKIAEGHRVWYRGQTFTLKAR